MRKLRIYVDTSVFGGARDEEFAEANRRFFEKVRASRHIILIPRVVTEELSGAPDSDRKILPSLPEGSIEFIENSDEIPRLAETYVREGAPGQLSFSDAAHVAAAVAAVDVNGFSCS
jgi:predicted nucleic acid-binding protein